MMRRKRRSPMDNDGYEGKVVDTDVDAAKSEEVPTKQVLNIPNYNCVNNLKFSSCLLSLLFSG
jgi:hypothetical protein